MSEGFKGCAMGDRTGIEWTDATWRCKSGPPAHAPRDGDKRQARRRINVEVREGRRPHPNTLPCVDCGHVWQVGERRHEYDHHLGYAAAHHYDVVPVCTICHAARDGKAGRSHCSRGHEFTPDNTYFPKGGGRVCRECHREHDRLRVRPPGYWQKINANRKVRRGKN